jgi:hypothetical protein
MFEAVNWRARRGLNADADSLSDVKQDARQRGDVERRSPIGICEGMDVFRGAELCAARGEGEIDLIGYDGERWCL